MPVATSTSAPSSSASRTLKDVPSTVTSTSRATTLKGRRGIGRHLEERLAFQQAHAALGILVANGDRAVGPQEHDGAVIEIDRTHLRDGGDLIGLQANDETGREQQEQTGGNRGQDASGDAMAEPLPHVAERAGGVALPRHRIARPGRGHETVNVGRVPPCGLVRRIGGAPGIDPGPQIRVVGIVLERHQPSGGFHRRAVRIAGWPVHPDSRTTVRGRISPLHQNVTAQAGAPGSGNGRHPRQSAHARR